MGWVGGHKNVPELVTSFLNVPLPDPRDNPQLQLLAKMATLGAFRRVSFIEANMTPIGRKM